jgi:hypothetical protein
VRRRRALRRWLVSLALLAACDPQTVAERSPYGARWWEEPAMRSPTPRATAAEATAATAAAGPTAPPGGGAARSPVAGSGAPREAPRATPTPPSPTPPSATPPAEPSAGPSATPTVGCDPAVLESEPSAPFDLIALVEVQSPRPNATGSSVLEAAKRQACALRGDAIVILYRHEREPSTPPIMRGPSGMLPNPELRAAVIRYRR